MKKYCATLQPHSPARNEALVDLVSHTFQVLMNGLSTKEFMISHFAVAVAVVAHIQVQMNWNQTKSNAIGLN